MPSAARWDESTPVRVTDLDPGQRVTLRATATAWFDDTGTSEVTFEATDDGVVDTSEQAPVAGDYDRVASTGWLWALSETGGPAGGRPTGDGDDVTVGLELRDDDGTRVATAETTRRRTDPGVDHESVVVERTVSTAADTDERVTVGVIGELFSPPEAGPHPAVLCLHGSAGRPLRGVASLLAAHGYIAFAVQYVGDHESLPDTLATVPVETVAAAADWLREQPAVRDDAIGLFGRSKGAELALESAVRFDWPATTVAVAPSRHRWQALDGGEEPRSSWRAGGDPLPFVPFRARPGETEDGAVVFRDTYVDSRERVSSDRLEAAAIDADAVDCPTLLVSGGDDLMWPAGEDAERLAATLRDGGVSVTHDHYPDAGHGLGVPYAPPTTATRAGEMALGGDPAANARAAGEHWQTVRDHLAETLEE